MALHVLDEIRSGEMKCETGMGGGSASFGNHGTVVVEPQMTRHACDTGWNLVNLDTCDELTLGICVEFQGNRIPKILIPLPLILNICSWPRSPNWASNHNCS